LVALDDRVVALRLRREDGLRLELSHENVVEGDVKSLRVLDEPVIRDDRNAVLDRLRDGRLDRRPVLREDDQDLRALRDAVVDVAGLSLRRRLGAIGTVLAAASRDRSLDRGLIPLRPALFLIVVPRHTDRARRGGRRRRTGRSSCWAAPASTTSTACRNDQREPCRYHS